MSSATHPLAPLSPAEIDAFRAAADAAGLVEASTRFAYIMLEEPSRVDYRAYEAGGTLPRLVSGLVMSLERAATSRIVVDVERGVVVANEDFDPVRDGLGPVLEEDYVAADEIVKADPAWRAAIERRGITDFDAVFCCPLSAGSGYYDEDEAGRRMLRVLAFRADHPTDSPWAHPIDGIVAHIDLIERRVTRIIEMDDRPIPAASGDHTDVEIAGPTRTSLKPISITQPEGVSFTLRDNVLEWEGWSIRVGFNGREGLTLHDVRVADRKVLHRASVSEMVVPYGDPTPMHGWQNYFDAGEYEFGNLANALELGCDCLGDITYLDAIMPDSHGRAKRLPNAICIHEEDDGILWKHNDAFTRIHETRRNRRLVISFFVTIGNYDYGFYWYFGLDGTVELEAKATGIVFTSGLTEEGRPYATELAPVSALPSTSTSSPHASSPGSTAKRTPSTSSTRSDSRSPRRTPGATRSPGRRPVCAPSRRRSASPTRASAGSGGSAPSTRRTTSASRTHSTSSRSRRPCSSPLMSRRLRSAPASPGSTSG